MPEHPKTEARHGAARWMRCLAGALLLCGWLLGPAPLPAARAAGAPARPSTTRPALKVLVDQDGMVQITPAALVAAGWDLASLDPRQLRLSHQGQDVPFWVAGEEDGAFAGSDYLLFYGQAMTGKYTRRNVYWLAAGNQGGPRMATQDASPAHGYPVPASFPATLHVEQDLAPNGYWQNPYGGEAQDHWYWTARLAAPAAAELPFGLPPFDAAAGEMRLRVALAGVSSDAQVNPDHHTRLRLNGQPADDARWDGGSEFRHEVALPPALFAQGSNTVRLETVGDTGAMTDLLYANWLEVDYRARYASQDDILAFAAPTAGDFQFQVTGFSSSDVAAYDVSDPAAPVRLQGLQSRQVGSSFTAIFEDHADAGSRYLALTAASRRAPAGLVVDQPSDLRSPANGADEIIIAYDDFYAGTLPLVALRQGQGLRVQAARLTDVYDEFGAGIATPQAIRDFLAYAYQYWQPPAPAYVLLVGDASVDYLDRFHTGKPNFVPTYVIDAGNIGETADDNWFACVDGDDPLPDLFVGRLPARSSSDVQAMVSKIIAYETAAPSGDWDRRMLYVADDSPIFQSAAEGWIDQLPPGYQPQRIYVHDYPPGDPQADVVTAINRGAFFVAYAGHGSQDRWGNWSGGRIFDTPAVAQLTNAGPLPIVATATCLDGFFPNPLLDYSLAEEMVRRPGGGAVGVWAPTALGAAAEHQVLFAELFRQLFARPQATLGSITTQAKLLAHAQGVSLELIETFELFGDPALRLQVSPGMRAYLPLLRKAPG